MATEQRSRKDWKAASAKGSTVTFRIEKKLQEAFQQVVSDQGKRQSEAIRELMLSTVKAAGRTDLLN